MDNETSREVRHDRAEDAGRNDGRVLPRRNFDREKLQPLAGMADWQFYSTVSAMNEWYYDDYTPRVNRYNFSVAQLGEQAAQIQKAVSQPRLFRIGVIAEYRQRQLDKAEAGAKANKDQTIAKERADNCTQVKGQMQQLAQENIVIYRINEKGERVVMDDAVRRAEREKLGKWVRENCAV